MSCSACNVIVTIVRLNGYFFCVCVCVWLFSLLCKKKTPKINLNELSIIALVLRSELLMWP